MDTMFKFGKKMTFTKDQLDSKLGFHGTQFYSEERFIVVDGQRYALRGPSRTEPDAWEYNELFEVSRDEVSAYHITTDYRDEMDEQSKLPKKD